MLSMTVRTCLMGLVAWCVLANVLLAGEVKPSAFGKPERAKPKGTDEELYGPYKGKTLEELWKIRNEVFKSGRMPTNTNEVQRFWQWYRTMDEKDPTYRSKTPIEFYGQVVDQNGTPVESATVDLSWGKGTNTVIQTPPDGRFSLSGVTGKALSVRVYKKGYLTGKIQTKSFNYAELWDQYFHIPNPTNPVLFRMLKLKGPEPMYVSTPSPKVDVSGTVVWIDVSSGQIGDTGDIGLSVVLDADTGEEIRGYTLNILAAQGGGVIVTNEEFMFHAPETGYVERITFPGDAAGPRGKSWQGPQKLKLYLKTVDNKYAALDVAVGLFARPEAWLDLVISFNPSGSRNLELGANRLNAKDAKRIRTQKRETGK